MTDHYADLEELRPLGESTHVPDDEVSGRGNAGRVEGQRRAAGFVSRSNEIDARRVIFATGSCNGVVTLCCSVRSAKGTDTHDGSDVPEGPDQEQSLQRLDGIGPTYKERLHDAGISTVSQLAAADPAALAERLGISDSRVLSWVEQAQQLSS